MIVVHAAIWTGLAILASPLSEAAVPRAPSTARTITAQLDAKDMSKQRPTVCTQQYEPVCGRIQGIRKTYSNRCYARADGADIVAQGPCAGPMVEPGPR